MVYQEYLNAARKHNHTCELIIKEIERLNEKKILTTMAKLSHLLSVSTVFDGTPFTLSDG